MFIPQGINSPKLPGCVADSNSANEEVRICTQDVLHPSLQIVRGAGDSGHVARWSPQSYLPMQA